MSKFKMRVVSKTFRPKKTAFTCLLFLRTQKIC